MAGRPRYKEMIAEIERRAKMEELTPLEWICGEIADGKSLSDIAKSITVAPLPGKTEGTAGRSMLSKYVHSLEGAGKALVPARTEGMHALVDEAMEIADSTEGSSKEEIAAAKIRIDMRLWKAERLNQNEFAIKQGVTINANVSVGGLHMEALLAKGVRPEMLALPPDIAEAEYEILEADSTVSHGMHVAG